MPQAALLTAHGQPLEVTQIDLDPPGAGEVLVTLAASGICHTDLSVAEGEFRAHVETPMPMVLGHEGAGVVAQVGPDVSKVNVGDHVVLSAIPQCGRCYF